MATQQKKLQTLADLLLNSTEGIIGTVYRLTPTRMLAMQRHVVQLYAPDGATESLFPKLPPAVFAMQVVTGPKPFCVSVGDKVVLPFDSSWNEIPILAFSHGEPQASALLDRLQLPFDEEIAQYRGDVYNAINFDRIENVSLVHEPTWKCPTINVAVLSYTTIESDQTKDWPLYQE